MTEHFSRLSNTYL